MKTVLKALVFILPLMLLAGCGDDGVENRKLSAEAMKGRLDAGTKKGSKGAVIEAYDPLPPADLKNKDIEFGAKVKDK